MKRLASGTTVQKAMFMAYDEDDLSTPLTGLTDFSVYYTKNGGTPVLMTTPTVVEASNVNLPGEYWLTLDEGTTITSGYRTEEVVYTVKATGMGDWKIQVELFTPETKFQLDELYAADGVAPTLEQAVMLMHQMLFDVEKSGSTILVKGLNGTTTVATMTMDNPTTTTTLHRTS